MKTKIAVIKAASVLLALSIMLALASCGLYDRITGGIENLNDVVNGMPDIGFGGVAVDGGDTTAVYNGDYTDGGHTAPDDFNLYDLIDGLGISNPFGGDAAETEHAMSTDTVMPYEFDPEIMESYSVSYDSDHFYLGDYISEKDFTVSVNYLDGREQEWPYGFEVEPSQLTKVGEQTVTITLAVSELSFDVDIYVKEPEIQDWNLVTSDDAKTEYEIGDSVDPDGFTMEVEYENGYIAYYDGDELTFSPAVLTEGGWQWIDVSYNGYSASTEVFVKEYEPVVDVKVYEYPEKMVYTVGEELDLGGLVIEVLDANGVYSYYGSDASFTIASTSDTDFDEPGEYPVLFYFRGEPFEICFTVTDTRPVRLEISRLPDVNIYTVGDSGIDVGGIELTVHYADGSSEEYYGDFTYTNPSLATAGVKAVTVSAMGLDAKYNIEVKAEKRITGFSITGVPTTAYAQGDTLKTNGMRLLVYYSDGSSSYVSSGFTCTPTRLDSVGKQTVTVKYGGYSAYFSVDVKAKVKTVSSISMASGPHATSYTKGSALIKDGIAINVYYTDGTSEVVTSGFTCSPELLNHAGDQTVTVNYKGKTATFKVNVVSFEKTLNSISIVSKPIKLGYRVGESLNTNGLAIVASYSDGTNENIVGGYTCSPTRFDKIGTQTVTVEYKGKVATFKVEVMSN